jgi:hypothetical protein
VSTATAAIAIAAHTGRLPACEGDECQHEGQTDGDDDGAGQRCEQRRPEVGQETADRGPDDEACDR